MKAVMHLSHNERAICRALGQTEEVYLRARAARESGKPLAVRPDLRESRLDPAAEGQMTADERRINSQFSVNPIDYAIRRDRDTLARGERELQELSAHAGGGRRRSTAGVTGKQVADENMDEVADGVSDDLDPAQLVVQAQDWLNSFAENPGHPDAWHDVTKAACLLLIALDDLAPGYAVRHQLGGRGDHNGLDAED